MKDQEGIELNSSDSEGDDDLPNIASLRERLANKVRGGNSSALSTVCRVTNCAVNQDTVPSITTACKENWNEHVNSESRSRIHAKTHCISSDDEDDVSESCVIPTDKQCQQQVGHLQNGVDMDNGRDRDSKDVNHVVNAVDGKNKKRKRSPEEIEESRRLAQEKKNEREKLRKIRDAEKEMKKAERAVKKQYSLQSCLQYISVLVDTHVVNSSGLGSAIFKTCEELGTRCVAQELQEPFTIMWQRSITQCNMVAEMKVEKADFELQEDEVLAVVPVADFVQMVSHFKQNQRGMHGAGLTPRVYVDRLKSRLEGKAVTVIVLGLEQYFREMKNGRKQQHRQAVLSLSNPDCTVKKTSGNVDMAVVSRVEVEEAVTDVQLQTGACTYMLDTPEQVADLVRRFTKAVAERPSKKDRFDTAFAFLEEGVSGVKVDKAGVGLLKVWKQQLQQFKNVSPDVAQALVAEYPAPQLLKQAYARCQTDKEAERLLENIVVRRGAGVLETTRRIGKELSRRLYTFFNSGDPELVIR